METASFIEAVKSLPSDMPADMRIILESLARHYLECENCRFAFEVMPFSSLDDVIELIEEEPSANILLCADHMMFRVRLDKGDPESGEMVFIGVFKNIFTLSSRTFRRWIDGSDLLNDIRMNGGSASTLAASGRRAREKGRFIITEERLFGVDLDVDPDGEIGGEQNDS